jgi:hypothetical protein
LPLGGLIAPPEDSGENHSTGGMAVRPLRASSKVIMIACEAPKIPDAPIVSP